MWLLSSLRENLRKRGTLTKLVSKIESAPSAQELCEMQVWRPPQGSLKEAIPLSIDLDFFAEHVAFPTTTFSASATRVTLYLKTLHASVVRGSRLGEYALDPDMVEEVTQSVRNAIENEIDATGSLEVTVEPGFFGKLTGLVRWRKRKSNIRERDHFIKTATRITRISPRPRLKWDIVEPIAPCILRGRYIGAYKDAEIGPLCLLTMEKSPCVVELKVAVKRQDIAIGDMAVSGSSIRSRNKQAVLEQLARRSIERNQVSSPGTTVHLDPNSIILCDCKMEIQIEDE